MGRSHCSCQTSFCRVTGLLHFSWGRSSFALEWIRNRMPFAVLTAISIGCRFVCKRVVFLLRVFWKGVTRMLAVNGIAVFIETAANWLWNICSIIVSHYIHGASSTCSVGSTDWAGDSWWWSDTKISSSWTTPLG